MRNRFGRRKKRNRWLGSILLPVAFFAALMSAFYIGVSSLDETARAEQIRTAEQAIRRAAVHCYAVEGQYPPSLSYLQEHYGIQVDEARFRVHYRQVGSNLMPEIIVFPLGQEQEEQQP